MAYEADINADISMDNQTGQVYFTDSVGNSVSSGALGKNLTYPSDLFTTSAPISPGVIKFYVHKIITGSQSQNAKQTVEAVGGALSNAGDNLTNLAQQGKTTGYVQSLIDGAVSVGNILGEAGQKFLEARIATRPAHQVITLYMPPSIQINDSMVYESIDTKGLSEALASASKNGSSALDDVVRNGGGREAITAAVLGKYARSGGPFSGSVANALIAEGIVPNPATKLLFKGPSLRQLQLDFKLIPRSEAEAKTISNIISAFRKAAYPTLRANTLNTLYTVPDLFRIQFQFRNKVNPFMIHYKSMYLTQVTTTYNQSGVSAFYSDASPVETNLTLTFQESELNSSDDVHEGWKSNPSPTARF